MESLNYSGFVKYLNKDDKTIKSISPLHCLPVFGTINIDLLQHDSNIFQMKKSTKLRAQTFYTTILLRVQY